MTAETVVQTIVNKVENGTITKNDVKELQNVISRDRKSIPFLDRSFLNGTDSTPPPSGTVLVRFVGMVQDQLETEYYLGQVNGKSTHYRDAPLLEESQQEQDDVDVAHLLAERQPLVVVPVPFSSRWLLESAALSPNTSNAARTSTTSKPIMAEEESVVNKKRESEDGVMDPPTKRKALSTPDTSLDDDSMEEGGDRAKTKSNDETTSPPTQTTSSDWWPAGCMNSDPNHCPVLAKLYYDQQEQDSNLSRLRLNEVVELVGVLSVDPLDADFSSQQQQSGEEPHIEWNDGFMDDFGMTLPPPSLLPRLHVLCYNRVNLESSDDERASTGDMNVDTSKNDDRSFAIQVLAKNVFNGNQDAAEALLMALMSMAEREQVSPGTWAPMKTPSETTLGCASLNLVLSSLEMCNKMTTRLQSVLAQILPIVGTVNLSRETLGTTVVSPAKDDSARCGPHSPLQLPRGSALIINESNLTQGPIDARAEETLRTLHSLTNAHSVPYRFEGSIMYPFEADYRVIVVSKATRGSKLLPCALTLKLSGDVVADDMEENDESIIPEEDAERIRLYLAKCRCNEQEQSADVFNVPLPKRLLELAQTDFIEKRADHREKAERRKRMQEMAVESVAPMEPLGPEVGEEDFHRWLTLARLQVRSRIPGESSEEMEKQTWADTMRLDEIMRS